MIGSIIRRFCIKRNRRNEVRIVFCAVCLIDIVGRGLAPAEDMHVDVIMSSNRKKVYGGSKPPPYGENDKF